MALINNRRAMLLAILAAAATMAPTAAAARARLLFPPTSPSSSSASSAHRRLRAADGIPIAAALTALPYQRYAGPASPEQVPGTDAYHPLERPYVAPPLDRQLLQRQPWQVQPQPQPQPQQPLPSADTTGALVLTQVLTGVPVTAAAINDANGSSNDNGDAGRRI
jgi:hypothetical protein